MNITESIRMALRSLRANTMRSMLTMLGIIIGTGAVIALLSTGQGAQAAITGQIESIGSNLIFVLAGRLDQAQRTGTLPTRVDPLTRQDAEAIRNSPITQHVAAVAPEINRTATITYRGDSTSVLLVGTTPDYEYVRNMHPAIGGFFTSGEETAGARVVVLGSFTAEALFGEPELALEQTVRINGVPFRVIGVLEKKGGQAFAGMSADSQAIVPLRTAQQRLYGDRSATASGYQVDIISISAYDEESIDAAIDEITWALREHRKIEFGEDDFTVTSQ